MTIGSIGFIGTGAITEAIVRGLLREPAFVAKAILSPRNADVAGRLAAEFPSVEIASDNQSVVERSRIIVLAIRPQIAQEVVRKLKFNGGQLVISVIAATSRDELHEWMGAGPRLVQAIPLPFVAERQGVTVIYPPDADVAAIFDVLGSAVICANKEEYDLLAAASAVMSTYFGVMSMLEDWLAEKGLGRSQARSYIAPLFASLAKCADRADSAPFVVLSREFATRGGLNEQVLSDFERHGGRLALSSALDAVLARIRGNKR